MEGPEEEKELKEENKYVINGEEKEEGIDTI